MSTKHRLDLAARLLILDALQFLLRKHYVMGTDDYLFIDRWTQQLKEYVELHNESLAD